MSAAESIALTGLLALLLALAVIDMRRRILPNVLIYPGAAAFTLFAALYFARPGTLGAGDVKLTGMIGVTLGLPDTLLGLALASVLAAGPTLVMIAAGRWSQHTRITCGPYLFAGAGA